jgi:tetratricopeptide (TPR) repeat protein
MIPASVLALLAVCAPDPNDDLVLAAALAQRGWIEIAEELCEKVRKDPAAGAKARSNLPLVMAEVSVEKARRESRADEIARFLDGSIQTLKAEANPGLELRTTLGWVLSEKGRLLAVRAEMEEGPDRAAVAGSAAQALVATEEFERALIVDLEKMPPSPEVEGALLQARFELPRALLTRARLAGPADSMRQALLTQALEGFIDIQYRAGHPVDWEAQLEEGRCLLELAQFAKAESKFQGLVDLQKLLPAKSFPVPLVHRATLYLAQTMTGAGKGKLTIALVDGFLKQNAALAGAGIGLALQLEKASALHAGNNDPAALALAAKVEKADPEGLLGKTARDRMRAWIGQGQPALWMTLADAEMAQGRHRDAARTYRQCIEACSTPAEKSTTGAAALFRMAECFRALHREAEAAAAFEQVFRLWPSHEFTPKAAVEAVRLAAREAALSGDPRDEERLEKLILDVEKLGVAVDFARFLHAERCERKGQLREAAELYRGVGDASEFFPRAMISSGHCYRVDAAKRGKEEAARELGLAEEALKRFLSWVDGGHEAGPQLVGIAWREIATIYMILGRSKDALTCLGKAPAEDAEGQLRKWELQVQLQLTEKKLDEASATLDNMLKEKPEAPATVRSCRLVFRALDRAMEDLVRARADATQVRETARRSAATASRWVDLARIQSPPPSTPDLVEAADSLCNSARRLNDFGDEVVSFMDLKGKAVPDRASWEAPASALRMLLDGKRPDLDAKDRLVAQVRLARCLGFLAADPKDWERAKMQYDSIVQEHKMVDRRGLLDPAVLQAQPSLLAIYIELGDVYFELGKRGQLFQFDNAAAVLGNTIRVMASGSETWWRARYQLIALLFERGKETDLRDARVLIENLERNNPEFDGGKFGMKEKFVDLKEKIRQVAGK